MSVWIWRKLVSEVMVRSLRRSSPRRARVCMAGEGLARMEEMEPAWLEGEEQAARVRRRGVARAMEAMRSLRVFMGEALGVGGVCLWGVIFAVA